MQISLNTIFILLSFVLTPINGNGQALFGVKSGILEQRIHGNGEEMTATYYFDDYGNKNCTLTDNGDSDSLKISMLKVNGKAYMVNKTDGTGIEMPYQKQINYLNPDAETIKEYDIEILGKDTILGRECTVVTTRITKSEHNLRLKLWIYKGIPLKTISQTKEVEITQETITFEENATIPEEMFAIPKIEDELYE